MFSLESKRKGDKIIDMSDKNIFEKAADIMENVTKFQKLSKLNAGYIERPEFKDSNLKKGFFCFNCIYWIDMTGGKCMIIDDKGPDVFGNTSDVIAAHGCCNGYEPKFDTINDKEEVMVDDNRKS